MSYYAFIYTHHTIQGTHEINNLELARFYLLNRGFVLAKTREYAHLTENMYTNIPQIYTSDVINNNQLQYQSKCPKWNNMCVNAQGLLVCEVSRTPQFLDNRLTDGREVSYDVGFNPSTQRHYRRLIYYLYIHSYIFRSYVHHRAEKYITTQLSSPKVVIYFSAWWWTYDRNM
jgi:hypothetical protein